MDNPAFMSARHFVDEVIAKGQPWTDKDFPPDSSSIANSDDSQDKIMKFKDLKWRRASQIYPKQEVFIDGIQPTDVEQGQLGDCYFLAVLSAMAENPERVKARFYTKHVNPVGIYLISLYINGYETPVIIDDYLPVRHNRPSFARSREGELWVILLEKAWAKVHGSYARTESGLPSFAATHCLGVPTFLWMHDSDLDEQKFWKRL